MIPSITLIKYYFKMNISFNARDFIPQNNFVSNTSNSAAMQFVPIPFVPNVPQLTSNLLFSMPYNTNVSLYSISNCIRIDNVTNFKLSINNICSQKMNVNSSIDNLKQSLHQLHSYNKSECLNNCNNAVQYNNQIQCGAPSAITALFTQEPDTAKCIVDLTNQKNNCINSCHKMNN